MVVKVALQDPLDSRFLPKIHQLHSAEPGRGEVPPPPGLVAATNSAMSAPAPAIRWKQFIRERRDASWSELLSLDLISVPAIPGNSAQGHWVSVYTHVLGLCVR